MNTLKLPEVAACAVGIIIGGAATWFVLMPTQHPHTDTHPIADPTDSEYHVHADFHIVVENELIDLSTEQYMTSATRTLHPDAHLHDGEGDIKHIHAEGITFADFLASLDITLTNDCITVAGTEYCTDAANELKLFVDDASYTDDFTAYIPSDNERILLYYGDPQNNQLSAYLDAVPQDACIYSGTCPERGTAPPESCGLTCEL